MKIEMDEGAVFAITVVAIAAVIITVLLTTGCTDNRIRTAPTLDARYKNPELRLCMTREMWAQTQLRHYEEKE